MPDVVRLEELKRILAGVRDLKGELNMKVWVCGTAACIGGWAARNAKFRALGLDFQTPEQCGGRHGNIVLWRKPKPLWGFNALEHFFDLDETQANYLFADNPCATGFDPIKSFDEGIARIDEILRGEI